MKKMIVLAFAFLSLSAQAVELSAQEIPSLHEASLVSVRIERAGGSEFSDFAKVIGRMSFSNSCMVTPLAKELARSEGGAREYRVLQVVENRACPAVFKPVTQEYVIDEISVRKGEEFPSVKINGVSAVLSSTQD